jgi:hypothetical protein
MRFLRGTNQLKVPSYRFARNPIGGFNVAAASSEDISGSIGHIGMALPQGLF